MSETPTDDARNESDANRTSDGRAKGGEKAVGALERRNFLRGLAVTGALGSAGGERLVERGAAAAAESDWEMKDPQIETP